MAKNKKDGINAVNQDFNNFEGVQKDQKYNLVENKEKDEFDEDFVIQTCDMSEYFEGSEQGKKAFAQKLGNALEEIGFAVLSGHGVDTNLYTQSEEKVTELFTSTTLNERMKYEAQRHGSVNQGYFPIKETTIIHPDLVEGWVFCRRAFNLDERSDFNAAEYWPKPNYEPFLGRLYNHMKN